MTIYRINIFHNEKDKLKEAWGLFCFFICFLTVSCSSRSKVKENIEQMMSKPINFVEKDMVKWTYKNKNCPKNQGASLLLFMLIVPNAHPAL